MQRFVGYGSLHSQCIIADACVVRRQFCLAGIVLLSLFASRNFVINKGKQLWLLEQSNSDHRNGDHPRPR